MSGATHVTVRVPLKIRRRPGRKTVVTPVEEEAGDGTIPARADPAVVKAVARASATSDCLTRGDTPRSAKWRRRSASSGATSGRCSG